MHFTRDRLKLIIRKKISINLFQFVYNFDRKIGLDK